MKSTYMLAFNRNKGNIEFFRCNVSGDSNKVANKSKKLKKKLSKF